MKEFKQQQHKLLTRKRCRMKYLKQQQKIGEKEETSWETDQAGTK